MEIGDLIESDRQVIYLGQATMPGELMAKTVFKSLIKKLFVLGNFIIKNDIEPVINLQYYSSEIVVQFKERDGAVVQNHVFPIITTATLADLGNDFYTWWATLSGNTYPTQFLSMRLYVQYGTFANALQVVSEIDLTSAKVSLYSESRLKIQNRTVSSTANDQADDVDNVPIQGRSFDFKTSGTQFRDYNTPAAPNISALTCNQWYGVLASAQPAETGSLMWKEVPNSSQFVGCQKVQGLRVQPGDVKKSVMYDSSEMYLTKFLYTVFARNPNAQPSRFQQIWLGKCRIFAFEKLMQPVATNEENHLSIAYEHNLEVGAIVSTTKNIHTAAAVINAIGPVA